MPRVRGFTLIELMVALAIIAILVMLGLPSYIDYVVRGKLVDGANALPALRARMELYYEDNRTYLGGPCATSAAAGSFTLVCTALTDTDYVIAATGSGMTQGFVFTIDNSGNESTTSLPSSWGSVPSSGYACWITRRGATC